MPRSTCVKTFDIIERSTECGHYEIQVRDFKGDLVANISKPTMREAQDELTRLGYIGIWDFPAVGIAFGRVAVRRMS